MRTLPARILKKRNNAMDIEFRDNWLKNWYLSGRHTKKIPSDVERLLADALDRIGAAGSSQDLRSRKSNKFEAKHGDLEGYHAIWVNDQWRLVFVVDDEKGELRDLFFADYH